MRYKPLTEQAADLEAVIAERFPSLSDEDRAEFCASVFYKVADLYRADRCWEPAASVVLVAYDDDGNPRGRRPLLITREPDAVVTA